MRPALARAAAGLAVLLAAVPTVGPTAGPAAAQVASGAATTSTTAPAAAGSVSLVSQTSWVGPGGELSLGLAVDSAGQADRDLEIAVSVFQPVTSRSNFVQTLAGKGLGAIIMSGFTAARLDELERGPGGAFSVRLFVQDPAQPRDRARLLLQRSGVYPVEVALRRTGATAIVSRFTTHLVYLAAPAEQKLQVALVLPASAPPALQPTGVVRVGSSAASRLAALARALDARPEVRVTIDPNPETLLALASGDADQRATVETLRSVASRDQVLSAPFVPVAVAAFDRLDRELTAQLARGDEVLSTTLGVRTSARTRVVQGPVDAATLARLRDQQANRLVVPEAALTPISTRVTPTQPFELGDRQGSRPVAAAADAGLGRHFRGGRDQVLAAHQLLADLAVLYLDAPGTTARGVVAVAAHGWTPTTAFLDATLAGLATSPVVQPVTLDQFFESVPAATSGRRNQPLVRTLAPGQVSSASLPDTVIREARERIESLGGVMDDGNPLFQQLEDLLLVSQSSALRGRQRTTYLNGINERITAETAQFQVARNGGVTLTARRGRIPITITSTAAYPARVVVQLSSTKLAFPDGRSATFELDRRNTTARFLVEARTSGAFPLEVTVRSPDGKLILHQSRVTVRSTSASGVGMVLSVSAAMFLIIWWARHIVRTRRGLG